MDGFPSAFTPAPAIGQHGGHFGASGVPLLYPVQDGPVRVPIQMQPFLLSVIGILDQVGSALVIPHISANAANLRMQVCSCVNSCPWHSLKCVHFVLRGFCKMQGERIISSVVWR
jgi:hypothetical protein